MDKIPDLLKNYGMLGLLLAIIAITDIPKSFFSALIKWFFEKKNKPYWPLEPARSSFIFPIIGMLDYMTTKVIRQEFFNELIKERKSKLSRIFEEIANVQVGFEQFKSRENIDFSSKVINIINGIPGVGKSSFVINYLEKMNSNGKVDFIFYFNSYSVNKAYTSLKNKQENTSNEQVWQELGNYNLDYTRLSSSLISYLLNYKFVYFIVDGIDKEEDCENIIFNLNRYINRFHKKIKT